MNEIAKPKSVSEMSLDELRAAYAQTIKREEEIRWEIYKRTLEYGVDN